MDAMQLTGIRGYGYTGHLPEEQVLGQWFEVDLTLWLDLSGAGSSDLLEDTVDYRQTITIVRDLIENSKFALIEKLATAIAELVLQSAQIDQVQVRLTKLAPPIPGYSGKITVELTRGRIITP